MDMNLRVDNVVGLGFAPVGLDQNSNNRPSSSGANKYFPQQGIRVESSKNGKNADDNLNPSWSDDEDGDDTELVVVSDSLPKVGIQGVDKCVRAANGKAIHPQRVGQIIDKSPPFPKKDAFKEVNSSAKGNAGCQQRVGRIIDVSPPFQQKDYSKLNAAQSLVTGTTQSFAGAQPTPYMGSSFGVNNIIYRGAQPVSNVNNGKVLSFRFPRSQPYGNPGQVGADIAKNSHNAVAELNRYGEAGQSKPYGLSDSSSMLEQTFIDEKAKEAAIHGCTTFTNEEMRRLAEFAQKVLGVYTGINELLIGKAWN